MQEHAKKVVAVLSLLAFILVVPLSVVWAINTLFEIYIEYSVKSWFATFILLLFFSPLSNFSYRDSTKNDSNQEDTV